MKLHQNRPAVDISSTDIGLKMDDIMTVLDDPDVNKVPTLFRQGHDLCICEITDDGLLRYVAAPDAHDLRGWLCNHVRFYKTVPTTQQQRASNPSLGNTQQIPAMPTDQLLNAFLRLGEWRNVPELRDTSRLPVVTKTGEVVTKPGYHHGLKLFLGPMPEINVPDDPSEQWLDWAKASFEKLFHDFEFEHEEHIANTLAAILTAPTRFMYDCPLPMYLFDANNKGSGKGTLAKVIGEIWKSPVSAQILPDDEDEIRKLIVSNLQNANKTMIVWDNVHHKLGGATLNALLTGDTFEGRILGSSRNIELPNNRLWCVTGNNIQLGADMGRRVVRVRLTPTSDPRRRDAGYWSIPDIATWTRENTDNLMRAALVMVKWWVARGMPLSSVVCDNYTPWAQTVGGILESVGIEGFLRDRALEVMDLDEEEEEILDFLDAIAGVIGNDTEFRPRDVAAWMTVPGFIDALPGPIRRAYERLGSVTKVAGRYLNNNRGKFCGPSGTFVERAPTWTERDKTYRIRNSTVRSNVSHGGTSTRPWSL